MAAFVLRTGAWMPQRQPHHQKLLQQDDDSTKLCAQNLTLPIQCAVSPPKHLLLLKTAPVYTSLSCNSSNFIGLKFHEFLFPS